jgi:hypothetical protein
MGTQEPIWRREGTGTDAWHRRLKFACDCTDQAELFKIASGVEDAKIRETAAEKITDNKMLVELIDINKGGEGRHNGHDRVVRHVCVKSKYLTDQRFIENIAQFDPYILIRFTAACRVENSDLRNQYLANIALNKQVPNNYKGGAEYSVFSRESHDEHEKQFNFHVRGYAIKELTDKKVLQEIATSFDKKHYIHEWTWHHRDMDENKEYSGKHSIDLCEMALKRLGELNGKKY